MTAEAGNTVGTDGASPQNLHILGYQIIGLSIIGLETPTVYRTIDYRTQKKTIDALLCLLVPNLI